MQINEKQGQKQPTMNFALAKVGAIDAITGYLAGQYTVVGDRGGQFHGGEMGKRRARKLQKYLQAIPDSLENDKIFFALFLALFGENTFFSQFGRSSMLAGMIADQWILGAREFGAVKINTLKSAVFSNAAIQLALESGDTTRVVSERRGYFDKTAGVRVIFSYMLKQLSPHERANVNARSEKLKKILKNDSEEINLSIIGRSAADIRYIEGALRGAAHGLGKTPEDIKTSARSHKKLRSAQTMQQQEAVAKDVKLVSRLADLPADVLTELASFLTVKEGGRLSQTRYAAHFHAQKQRLEEPAPMDQKKQKLKSRSVTESRPAQSGASTHKPTHLFFFGGASPQSLDPLFSLPSKAALAMGSAASAELIRREVLDYMGAFKAAQEESDSATCMECLAHLQALSEAFEINETNYGIKEFLEEISFGKPLGK